MATKPCPTCGKQVQGLGLHWAHLPDHRPDLEGYRMELITGCLLGDGFADPVSNNTSIGVVSTNKRFLEWLAGELDPVINARGVRVQATPEESAQHVRDGLGKEPRAPSRYKTVYVLKTATHPQLNRFADWYGDDGKAPPEDLDLTPMVAKMWYCGDGGISWAPGAFANGFAGIAVHSLPDGVCEALVSEFGKLGFSTNHTAGRIQFATADTPGFLGWLGDPSPGFEYKWEASDYDRYKMLKQQRGVINNRGGWEERD